MRKDRTLFEAVLRATKFSFEPGWGGGGGGLGGGGGGGGS